MRNWILRDHCDDSLIEAIERNVIERIMYFPSRHPKMDVIVEEDLILVDSKMLSSYLNAICPIKFIPEDLSARVKKANSYFKEKKTPYTWFIGPTTPIEFLRKTLISEGLEKKFKMPCLVLNMHLYKAKPNYIPGFRIQHALMPSVLKDFAKVLTSLIDPKEEVEHYFEFISSLALHSSDPSRLFVGYLNDVPVIIGELYFGAGLAGINTLVDKNHGSSVKDLVVDMTTKMVKIAKDQGYQYAVATAKQDILPFYQNLGFKRRCDFYFFSEKSV